MKLKDLTGMKIGKLMVVRRSACTNKSRNVMWDCMCECGTLTTVFGNNLSRNHTTSCGCVKRHDNLEGKIVGGFMVKSVAGKEKRQIKWNCQCNICGENKIFWSCQLTNTNHLKCDNCAKRNQTDERMKKFENKKFGNLTVIEYKGFAQYSQNRKNHIWDCLCSCGKRVIISEITLKKGRMCHSCATKKGENHHSWNPDISIEDRITKANKRQGYNYINWRNSILEKYQYTCQISNVIGGKLNAHHLYSWHSHRELRHDVNNGILISEKLHKLFHSLYGKKFNTPEQFDDFKRRYTAGEFTRNQRCCE